MAHKAGESRTKWEVHFVKRKQKEKKKRKKPTCSKQNVKYHRVQKISESKANMEVSKSDGQENKCTDTHVCVFVKLKDAVGLDDHAAQRQAHQHEEQALPRTATPRQRPAGRPRRDWRGP